MPVINYVIPSGATVAVEVAAGKTVMQGAVDGNVDGILAECGGNLSCATCHVLVEANGVFDAPSEDELDMLDFMDGVEETSRLSCQLPVTEACESAVVTVAATNM